jgi:hypothetical protein
MSNGLFPATEELTAMVPVKVPLESPVGSTETVIFNGVEFPAEMADNHGTPFDVEASTETGTEVPEVIWTCWLGGRTVAPGE